MKIQFPPIHKKKRQVYLDHAAATPLSPSVFRSMRPYIDSSFANPSPLYSRAVDVRAAIERARDTVAKILHTQPDTIVFTASGTESANMAILGMARAYLKKHNKPGHIVTSAIEHHAVLGPIEALEREGWQVTYVPVNEYGQVQASDVANVLRPNTVLVSVMYVNNEIGTIEPIADIGRELLKWRKSQNSVYPYFHTDACQAAAYLDLAVSRMHVDLMTLNGSKIYGPKGSGVLYKARGVVIEPLVYGGGQEMGFRSGTENTSVIIGFARALELVQKEQKQSTKKQQELQQYFWRELRKQIPDVILNGPLITKDTEDRLPNNINITIPGVEAETVILYLDTYGIECSAGSACTTNDDDVSHVLVACGVDREKAKQTIRLTMGKQTTKKDMIYVLKYINGVVKGARAVREFELSTDVAPS